MTPQLDLDRSTVPPRADPAGRGPHSVKSSVRLSRPQSPLDGLAVRARAWGAEREDAPTVVMIHGLVVSSAFLVPAAERLGDRFRVLAPDLPGFGASEVPERPLSVPELGTAAIEWMDAWRVRGAALVAVSFGCQVATEVALRRPDLVERLVLAGPTMDPAARTVAGQLRRWRRERRTQSRPMKRLIRREYRRAGLRRAFHTLRYALEDRIEERLPFIERPTLVVRGTEDPVVPGAWAEETVRLLPRGRLRVLDGVPHAMSFDAPDRFADAVREFLLDEAID